MAMTTVGLVLIVSSGIGLLLLLGLFAVLFSGWFRAVLASIAGTFVLVVCGLFAVSAFLFVGRHENAREVARVPVPQGDNLKIVETPSPEARRPLTAEAPDEGPSDAARRDAESAAETADPPTGAPRPAWMDGQMGRVGDVYRTTVKIGPAFSRTECEKQLSNALHEAVRTYADHLLGDGRGQFVDLPAAYVQNHLLRGEWEERRETTYDTMLTLHELLEFDREANEAIEANYRQSVVASRLAYTAAGGGVVLGLLTILFGYLKLDTRTRGARAGRLRWTAAAAILALAAVAGLLVFAWVGVRGGWAS